MPSVHLHDAVYFTSPNVFHQIPAEENDTICVLAELAKHGGVENVLTTLSKIHGPWAFAYWQASFLVVF